MRKALVIRRGLAWKIAACGISPLFIAASAEAQTFAISIGIRENASTAPIGDNGGATGFGIEFVNLNGQTLVADGTWQQFVFNFQGDPLTAFAGTTANGMYDGTRGTLEHIRITNSSGVTDPIRVHLDSIVNTDSGTPTVVSGFEQTDPFPAFSGSGHMFQPPRFSGSTQGFLLASPDTALVTDEVAQAGDQSMAFNFGFNSNNPANWVRLTTFNGPGQPNPTIDWTDGNMLSFWLRAEVIAPAIVWSNTGGGNWTDPANWSGAVPNGQNDTARFLEAITAPSTITINEPVTINTIQIRNNNSLTFAGTETLTFAGSAQQPRNIFVEMGNHTFTAPIEVLVSSGTSAFMVFNVARAQDVLTVQSEIAINILGGQTLTIQKQGPGRLNINNIETPDPLFSPTNILVSGGTMGLLPNSGRTRVNGLSIAGGVTPTARFDITNNPVVIDYAEVDPPASPLNTIRAQVAAGFNGGAWDGNGIVSSQGNSGQFGVGYAEAANLPSVPAIFGDVDATAILMRLTRYGDANLDGVVNLADFNRLAANFGASDAFWSQGDFNYDGLVNLQDFNRLAANFGLQAGPEGPTPDDWAALASAVPEPSSLALLGLGGLGLIRRRRRH